MKLFSGSLAAVIFVALGLTPVSAFSQTDRFSDTEIFSSDEITIINDIKYGSAMNGSSVMQDLMLNIYLPDSLSDTMRYRPLIIFVHGGSFKGGDKKTYDDYCLAFAQRGYVTASINYRVGWNKGAGCSGDPQDLNKAFYRCVQDTKAAIRYLAHFKDVYHIDSDNIFLTGESAGAADILHVAFADDSEMTAITENTYAVLGPVDSSGNDYHPAYTIRGCSSKSGGVFASSIMDNATNIPVISFHGTHDNIVPFDTGAIFDCYQPVFFKDICGSVVVTDQLDSLGYSYELNYLPGGDHKDSIYCKAYIIERTALFFHDILNDVPVHIRQISGLEVTATPAYTYHCGIFTSCDVTVNAFMGDEPYNYSADNIHWSANNTFSAEPGTYTYYVRDNATNVQTVTVTISGDTTPMEPAVLNISGAAAICENNALTLYCITEKESIQWYRNDVAAGNDDTLYINDAGAYYAMVRTAEGCTMNSDTLHLTVNANPVTEITADRTGEICDGTSVTLHAGEGDFNYTWSNGATEEFLILNTISQNGDYTVSVTDTNGCAASSDVYSVVFLPATAITISAAGPTTYCTGGSVVLNATSTATSYQWRKNGQAMMGANGKAFTATAAGTYTCTASGSCGSVTSNSIPVTIAKTPKASISSNSLTNLLCGGNTIILKAAETGDVAYQWYKGPHILSGETAQTFSTTKSGTYKCYIENTTGCGKYSNQISLISLCREEEPGINAMLIHPNPNNGILYVSADVKENTIIKIMDFTGQIIYNTVYTNTGQQIDMRTQPDGMYFVIMENNGIQSIEKIIKQ